MSIARHIIVKGLVQGVGYRHFVTEAAMAHGLHGLVRNRMSGTVEAVLIGSAHAVNATIEVCKRGPRSAQVEAVEQSDATPEQRALGVGSSFTVLATV
jgi:acylphosphatase